MKRIEKIEVRKGQNVYVYTGSITKFDEENVLVETTRGESLVFRKNQIEGRQLVEMKGDEMSGKAKTH